MPRQIVQLGKEIKAALVERDDQVEGMMAAILARQHVVFVGAPGTAKSLQLLMLTRHIQGARIFERLLFETTPTEEVLGPLSLTELKKDHYQRVTTGKIQECHFAYLEEVFNGNDPILHALLRIMNERLYENDGQVSKVPLESVVAATNIIPSKDALMAVYDRFLLRYKVDYIQDDDNFLRMMSTGDPEAQVKTTMTLDDLHLAQSEAMSLDVPKEVMEALMEIRRGLKKEGIRPSDRRFKQMLSVVRAGAFLRGQDSVGMDDLAIVRHMVWTTPNEIPKSMAITIGVASPLLAKVEEVYDDLLKNYQEAEQQAQDPAKFLSVTTEWLGRVNKRKKEIKNLIDQMKREKRDSSRAEEFLTRLEDRQQRVTQRLLDKTGASGK